MKFLSRHLAAIAVGLCAASCALAETLWIDVRSPEEFAADHIAGDLNIPHHRIAAEIARHAPGRDADIRLYCRSGNRSGQALKVLQAQGYTQVTNAGSIGDARKARGLPCDRC